LNLAEERIIDRLHSKYHRLSLPEIEKPLRYISATIERLISRCFRSGR